MTALRGKDDSADEARRMFNTFAQAYDGVHATLREEQGYALVTSLCEALSGAKVQYDSSLDAILDVGHRLCELYVRATGARMEFNRICDALNKVTGMSTHVNLAPLKG